MTALTMAHEQGPQAAWYNGRYVHELWQSATVAGMPSIELASGVEKEYKYLCVKQVLAR